jgi:N-acetylglutamate synthase-like GNAT family acetyltransferase
MAIQIRPATPTDRAAILALMRPRDYNRLGLDPTCFLVAEAAGRVIGIGQIKRHWDRAPELASLVVAPAWQGQGVGSALVRALLARHQGVLYLFCLAQLEGYYVRFGFRRVARSELPLSLALMHAVGNALGQLLRLTGQPSLQIIAMRIELPPHA